MKEKVVDPTPQIEIMNDILHSSHSYTIYAFTVLEGMLIIVSFDVDVQEYKSKYM